MIAIAFLTMNILDLFGILFTNSLTCGGITFLRFFSSEKTELLILHFTGKHPCAAIRTSYCHQLQWSQCALESCRQQVNNDHVGYSIKKNRKIISEQHSEVMYQRDSNLFSEHISHIRHSVSVRTWLHSSPEQIFHRRCGKFLGHSALTEVSCFALSLWMNSSGNIDQPRDGSQDQPRLSAIWQAHDLRAGLR